jgi:hypothetical protein
MRIPPTIHRDFKIGQEVWADISEKSKSVIIHGIITGIASLNIFYTYIVTLNEPLHVPDYSVPWTTIGLPGQMLKTKVDVLK